MISTKHKQGAVSLDTNPRVSTRTVVIDYSCDPVQCPALTLPTVTQLCSEGSMGVFLLFTKYTALKLGASYAQF